STSSSSDSATSALPVPLCRRTRTIAVAFAILPHGRNTIHHRSSVTDQCTCGINAWRADIESVCNVDVESCTRRAAIRLHQLAYLARHGTCYFAKEHVSLEVTLSSGPRRLLEAISRAYSSLRGKAR